MLFARDTGGSRTWTCPYCGHVNRHKLIGCQWLFICAGHGCKREVGFGLIAYGVKAGLHKPPPDMLFASEPWMSGRNANRILCDACAVVISDPRERLADEREARMRRLSKDLRKKAMSKTRIDFNKA